ncbi:MAG: hypothetical protein HY248_03540 [Fimbriimonas ginsengisoli]|uniref:Uncharacterized protein n=1 Tax=Fimbriimonas ginsengisoli TaxID=1005039 RepID=A0A931LWA1_FIMGI|nr:hypothetical protein [Fimbriimonas ginsengisoli]MBI3721603.1 hypothetical protein [Fimbriimonas ginsengisoli]
MDKQESISRREALGLFKAVAALGTGLLVTRSVFAGQQEEMGGSLTQKLAYGEYECEFLVHSALTLKMRRGPARFALKLPPEMMKLLITDPRSNVQIKLVKWDAKQVKGQLIWGSADVKLNQGILIGLNRGYLQDKLVPLPPRPGG